MLATLNEWLKQLSSIATERHIASLLSAVIIFFVGLYLSRYLRNAISKSKNIDPERRPFLEKLVYVGTVTATIMLALDALGFEIKVLLGAAGVLTVAVGFAAQTSASNLISGLFLMFERPFVTGNVINVGDITGVVLSIDLLSTKIRTFTNTMVRIPNATLVTSNIVNFSYFPIRRIDLNIGVDYSSNLQFVQKVLLEAIQGNPLILRNPDPIIEMSSFGDSSIGFTVRVWAETGLFDRAKSDLYLGINSALQSNGINIPFPTRTIIQASTAPVQSPTSP